MTYEGEAFAKPGLQVCNRPTRPANLTGIDPNADVKLVPVGATDLLASYTYRIAFQDAGQNFGLAAAIATLIFLLVAGLSWLNLRLSKVKV